MPQKAGEYIAHVRKRDGICQTLEDHLQGVAILSRRFGEKIGLGYMGELLGLLHDAGKYSKEFQTYLASAEGLLDQDCDDYVDAEQKKGKIDHSTAGAQVAWRILNKKDKNHREIGQILAMALVSHHSGLIDCLAPDGTSIFERRINKADSKSHFTEISQKISPQVEARIREILDGEEIFLEFQRLLENILTQEKKHGKDGLLQASFKMGLALRMIFSCLIDGDRTDTADFEKDWAADNRQRGAYVPWAVLVNRLEKHLQSFDSSGPINEGRKRVSADCLEAAKKPKGFFTLSVPTGGGKTLASLRFALQHALHAEGSPEAIDRIIYVIPYTSIIDQNAEKAREILELPCEKDRVVLECHSNLAGDRETWQNRLLSENWDAPIVFTTMVQFLEAIFGGGTKSVRRMHQLANSILIFDEIQTLPVRTVHMFCNALNFLVEQGGATALLCTATQPLLHRVDKKLGALRTPSDSEIVKDVPSLFKVFNRVKILDKTKPEGYTDEELAALVLEQQKKFSTCLVIVNTTAMAQRLYSAVSERFAETVHLSATMCPAHRRKVLDGVRVALEQNPQSPLICVATQVIEAGVDVDFGSVVRCVAGLDSVAQAAGRCNRHGHRKNGEVLIVNPAEDPIDRLVDIRVGRDETRTLLWELKAQGIAELDILHPKIISQYFERYFFKRAKDMAYPVKESRDDSLLNMLSSNVWADSKYQSSGPATSILLKQSFSTAASLFQALDISSRGVLVPYLEGERIIADLSGEIYDPAQGWALLRQAQQYTVNVYPNILEKLSKAGAVYQVKDLGVFALREEFYSPNLGLTPEPASRFKLEVC